MTYQKENELFTLKPQDPIKGKGKVSTGNRGFPQLNTAGTHKRKPRPPKIRIQRYTAKCHTGESRFRQALTTRQGIIWQLGQVICEAALLKPAACACLFSHGLMICGAVECDNGVCVQSIKRHYHTK